MKKCLLILLVMFSTFSLTAQSDWDEVKWDNGMKIENPEKGYKIKFGGRIMFDILSAWPEQNGVIDTLISGGSGVEFRRLRFLALARSTPILNTNFSLILPEDLHS